MCVCKSSNASAKIAEHMYTQEVPRITEKNGLVARDKRFCLKCTVLKNVKTTVTSCHIMKQILSCFTS